MQISVLDLEVAMLLALLTVTILTRTLQDLPTVMMMILKPLLMAWMGITMEDTGIATHVVRYSIYLKIIFTKCC